MNKRHILGFFDDLVRTPAFLFLCAMFLCGAAAGGLTGLRAAEGDGATALSAMLAALPALFTIYGVIMLVSGVMKLQRMADMRRIRHPRWYMPGISALLYIILAVIILLNPFSTAMVVWIFVGVSMIVSAVLDMITLIIAG